eukprot:jgi/Picsp_1/4132/NSC_01641-R1_amidase family protein
MPTHAYGVEDTRTCFEECSEAEESKLHVATVSGKCNDPEVNSRVSCENGCDNMAATDGIGMVGTGQTESQADDENRDVHSEDGEDVNDVGEGFNGSEDRDKGQAAHGCGRGAAGPAAGISWYRGSARFVGPGLVAAVCCAAGLLGWKLWRVRKRASLDTDNGEWRSAGVEKMKRKKKGLQSNGVGGNVGKRRAPRYQLQDVCIKVLNLTQPSVKVTGTGKNNAEMMLKGMTFVVSDRMDVVGEMTISGTRPEATMPRISQKEDKSRKNTFLVEEASIGGDSVKKHHACSLSAPAIDMAIQQGAACVGIAASTPHNNGLNRVKNYKLDNIASMSWISGENCAAAITQGLCDFSFAIDEIGSAIGAAAISGVIAYRPTSGMIIDEGVNAMSPTLSSVCILSREGKVLQQVSRALDVPKIEFQDTLERFLVAEDLFKICNQEMIDSLPAVIQTIKRWAGPDQAQSLSLCSWIYHRIPSVVKFVSCSKDGQPSTEEILKGLVKASDIILSHEQESYYGNHPSSGDYHAALEVAEGLSLACRSAMQEGLVFVIPSVPGFFPEFKNITSDESEQYMSKCRQFASISNLAGIPQVSLPLDHPSGVLGISCLALQRKDYSLLRSADKIKTFLKEEVSTQLRNSAKKIRSGKKSAEVDSQRKIKEENVLVAERAKEEGNKCFKAKQYKEAVSNYSRAIYLDPHNPVYFSNRAMAYLKLGGYQQAEEDCTRALKLDPCLVKALLRRGASRVATCAFELAKEDFERVLDLEPNNRQALQELRDVTTLLDG